MKNKCDILIELLAVPAVLSRRSFFANAQATSLNAGRRQVRKVFTLIELLVVIAIISILMAILLPALKKAKDTALTIDCKNRLKGLGQASFLYVGDYDDCIPHMTAANTDVCAGTQLLASYTVSTISDSIYVAKPNIGNPAMCQAFVSNADPAYLGRGISGAAPYQEYSRTCYYHFTSYSQSSFLYLGYQGTTGPYYSAGVRGDRTANTMIRLREIKYPSDGINYFEGKNSNYTDGFENYSDPIAYKPRHNYDFPSVMFDGSVRDWNRSYEKYGRCHLYNGHPNMDYPTPETWRAWLCYIYFTY